MIGRARRIWEPVFWSEIGMTVRAFVLLVTIVVARIVSADRPLPPPSIKTTCSVNGLYCATSNPKTNAISVYRKGAQEDPLWSVKGWARVFDVADSGKHLVTCYDGMNLLPLDYNQDWPMLSFYEQGKLVRRVSLRELIHDLSRLRRTASHYEWGRCVGFVGTATYAVETVDRGTLRFDVTTGRLTP